MASTRNQVLGGQVVVLTRPKESCAELTAALEDLGARVRVLPTITVQACEISEEITASVRAELNTEHYGGIIFTSARAVTAFLHALGPGPWKLPAFCVGPKTSQALKPHWSGPITQASEPRAHGLVETISAATPTPARFLFACSTLARPVIEEGLSERKHQVTRLELYETRPLTAPLTPVPELELGTWVVVASPSAARGLINSGIELERTRIACIGPTTRAAALELGLSVEACAKYPSTTGLCEAIVEACSQQSPG